MKCINCGANYATRKEKCPYCGTPNQIGVKWTREENTAKENFEKTKRYITKSLPLFIVDHICNLLIIGFAVLMIVAVVLGLLINQLDKMKVFDGSQSPEYKKADYELMDRCLEEDDYYTLKEHMDEYHLRNDKKNQFAKYVEYLEIHEKVSRFVFFAEIYGNRSKEQLEEENDYTIYNIVASASSYLTLSLSWKYRSENQEKDAVNQKFYSENKEFIFAFLQMKLGMTQEECETLCKEKTKREEIEKVVQTVYERKGWRYQKNAD